MVASARSHKKDAGFFGLLEDAGLLAHPGNFFIIFAVMMDKVIALKREYQNTDILSNSQSLFTEICIPS